MIEEAPEIKRYRLSKAPGFKLPPNTVRVDSATKWGNPFKPLGGRVMLPKHMQAGNWSQRRGRVTISMEMDYLRAQYGLPVRQFQHMLEKYGRWVVPARPGFPCPTVEDVKRELRGKHLADWIPPSMSSHADVLMAIANDWPSMPNILGPGFQSQAMEEAVQKMKELWRK